MRFLVYKKISIAVIIIVVFTFILKFGIVRVGENGSFGNKVALVKTLGEGEEFEQAGWLPINPCSVGLKPVIDAIDAGDKLHCGIPMCPCYVCAKCGDGICGKGENLCNCPEDCK